MDGRMRNAITDIAGIKVGHYTDRDGVTGCTVILCEEGAVAGVDVRGSAPGTRETDLLSPTSLVQKVNAILLSGGSAFGLDAASGVMRYLEERGCGYDAGVARVPVVPAAIIFDLALGSANARPGYLQGYKACLSADDGEVLEGSVGVGTGATVAKILGMKRAIKGGVGTASQEVGRGLVVGALVVVNALGDVVDPSTGKTLAGPRREDGKGFLSTLELLKSGEISKWQVGLAGNTTLGIVATNASLDKAQANKLAQMAQDGIAMAVRPAHTMYDGDVIFALATGKMGQGADLTALGSVAAEIVAKAVVRAIAQAESLGGVPAAKDVAG